MSNIINSFIYFIREREAIRIMKDEKRLPPPWTDDPILRAWRFCNVDRCKDRETVWIFDNIIKAHPDSQKVWFNLAIARFFNWSPTLEELGYFEEWSPDRLRDVVTARQARKEKVYTGAYMIRAGTGEDAQMAKHDYLIKRVFSPLWDKRNDLPRHYSCKEWDDFFGSVFGMGDFMRNQIITDMKYSHHLPKAKTGDWFRFCLPGPGTKRGLNRLMEKDITAPIKDGNGLLQKLRKIVHPHVRFYFDAGVFDDLNNISNCCCEFDKYMRVKEGTGEPRARYVHGSLLNK